MNLRIDYSEIDLVALRQINIHSKEIQDVLDNPNSIFKDWGSAVFVVGFSFKRKFIRFVYQVAKNPNFDIEILQVDLPYEDDIQSYWCKKGK